MNNPADEDSAPHLITAALPGAAPARITLSVPGGTDERTSADLRAAEQLLGDAPGPNRELLERALAGLTRSSASPGGQERPR